MINNISSLLGSLGSSIGGSGGSDNQDLMNERKAMQRQSLKEGNENFKLSEQKKNAEALR